jgi:hypothetical protein
MTIEELKDRNLIIMECISGSKAYGLNTPTSDTDIKGVFVLPKDKFYSLNYIPQINNDTNDIVYYELGRYIELLTVNNPNILELLNSPEDAVLFKHPTLNVLKPEIFLSKLCLNTFGRFALSQIKKARSLNKKIFNPVEKDKKTILSFCYVSYGQGAIPLSKFLEIKKWEPEDCGLVNIPHMKDVYGLYHNKQHSYEGIIKSHESNDVSLSSIPPDENQVGLMFFNRDGYSTYCREYREYWEWVKNRNEIRFENVQSHGKNYDAKNMMHVFRLLEMAIEIAKTNKINVKREDRNFLLQIKSGHFEYDELLKLAEMKQAEMENAFKESSLPDYPDKEKIDTLAYTIRDYFYSH